ncbi:uncharacterized protein NPIL_411481 [Nephila pilipes]|uniref:Uncharacterized protein n=1 Tax=Nephila pilipes TaxID=299642 RepID=A0A8X6IKZ3_NEPPI|nr:uncharacterized protein NPIL_411481 [Nephila pilipes]
MARGSANNVVGSKSRAKKSSQVKEKEIKKVSSPVQRSMSRHIERTTAQKIVKKSAVKKTNVQKKENKVIKTGNRKIQNEKKVPVKRNKKEENSVETAKTERVSRKRKAEDDSCLEENHMIENIVKDKNICNQPIRKRKKIDPSGNKNDAIKIPGKGSEREIDVKEASVETSSRKTRNLKKTIVDCKLNEDSQKEEHTKLRGTKINQKPQALGKRTAKNYESQSSTDVGNVVKAETNVRKTRNTKKIFDGRNIEINNQDKKTKDLQTKIIEPLVKDVIKSEVVESNVMEGSIKLIKKITDSKSIIRTKKNSLLENSVQKTRNTKKPRENVDKVSEIGTESDLKSKEMENFAEMYNSNSKIEGFKVKKIGESGRKTRIIKISEEVKTDLKSSKNDIKVPETKIEAKKLIQETGARKTRTMKRVGNKSNTFKNAIENTESLIEDNEKICNSQSENETMGKISDKQKLLKNEMDSAQIMKKKTRRGTKTISNNMVPIEDMQNFKKSVVLDDNESETYKMSKTRSGATRQGMEQNSKLIQLKGEMTEEKDDKVIELNRQSSVDPAKNEKIKKGPRKNKTEKMKRNENREETNVKDNIERGKEISGKKLNVLENKTCSKTNQDLQEKEIFLVNEEARQKSFRLSENENSQMQECEEDGSKNIKKITEFQEENSENKLSLNEIEHHMDTSLSHMNEISNNMDVKNCHENKENSDKDIKIYETEVKQKIDEIKDSEGICCQTNLHSVLSKTFESDCEPEINEIHELENEERELGTEIICKMSVENRSEIKQISKKLINVDIESSEQSLLIKDDFSENHADKNDNEQVKEEKIIRLEKTVELMNVEIENSVSNTDMNEIKEDCKSIGMKSSVEIDILDVEKETFENIKKDGANNEEYSENILESLEAKSENLQSHPEMENVPDNLSEKDLKIDDIQNSTLVEEVAFQRKSCENGENSKALNDKIVLAKNTETHDEVKEIEYKNGSKYEKECSNVIMTEAACESSCSKTVEICCKDIEVKNSEALEYSTKEAKNNEELESVKAENENCDITVTNFQNLRVEADICGNVLSNMNCILENSDLSDTKNESLTEGNLLECKYADELCRENVTNLEEKNEFQSRVESPGGETKKLNETLKSRYEENFNSEILEKNVPDQEVLNKNSVNMSESAKVEYHSTEKIIINDSNLKLKENDEEKNIEFQSEVEIPDDEMKKMNETSKFQEEENFNVKVLGENVSDYEEQNKNSKILFEYAKVVYLTEKIIMKDSILKGNENDEINNEFQSRVEIPEDEMKKLKEISKPQEEENFNSEVLEKNIPDYKLQNKNSENISEFAKVESLNTEEVIIKNFNLNCKENDKKCDKFQSKAEIPADEVKKLNETLKSQEENFDIEILEKNVPEFEEQNKNLSESDIMGHQNKEKIIEKYSDLENESCDSSLEIMKAIETSDYNSFDKKIENHEKDNFENKVKNICNDSEPKELLLITTCRNEQFSETRKGLSHFDESLKKTLYSDNKLLEEDSNAFEHLRKIADYNEYMEVMSHYNYKDSNSHNKGKSDDEMRNIFVQGVTEVEDYDDGINLQIEEVIGCKCGGKKSADCPVHLLEISAEENEQEFEYVTDKIKNLNGIPNEEEVSEEMLTYGKEQIFVIIPNDENHPKKSPSGDKYEPTIEVYLNKNQVLSETNSFRHQLDKVAQQFNEQTDVTKTDIHKESEILVLENADKIVNDTKANDLNKDTENSNEKMNDESELIVGSSVASTYNASKEVSNELFPNGNKELVDYTNKKNSCTELSILSEENHVPVMTSGKLIICEEFDANLQSRNTCLLSEPDVSKSENGNEIFNVTDLKEQQTNSELPCKQVGETIHKTSQSFESSNTSVVQQKKLDCGTISIVKKEGNRKKTRVVKTSGDLKQVSDEELRIFSVNPELSKINNSTNSRKSVKRKPEIEENQSSKTEQGSSTKVSMKNACDPDRNIFKLLLVRGIETSSDVEIQNSHNRTIDPSQPGPSWLESEAELECRKRKASSAFNPLQSTSNEAKRLRVRNSSAPVRMYLEQFVPFLLEGLLKITYVRPNDPIQYLADWMKANKAAAYERMNS